MKKSIILAPVKGDGQKQMYHYIISTFNEIQFGTKHDFGVLNRRFCL